MSDGSRFLELRGEELLPWLDGLGELRIAVFREYPYLYDGSLEYERDYLKVYARSEGSLVVLVTDEAGERVLGATTCLPLKDEGEEFQKPFLEKGYDVEKIGYFGESILLPELRGRGIGKEFFKRREAHAQRLGMKWTTFCAVDRAEDHPMRPKGYRPLNEFWRAQGYVQHPELQTTFVWKEMGEAEESPKMLTFWMKSWQN
ncbi:GNAT family N-acetyltransferase [Phragmitibacter flavus]|uniref:GNAT family N-acetyltransferase n=1 Tax=Phragmitibacter flavus TaxID=2576071 RepID=A0A5R8KA66_9BACT|nr:GNAT family N-acetyltransferase [Phragmitibacter flavus]TLD69198.1 GNAT family N-acetyltransferase [Phragmitibacter flavus]